MVERSEGDGDVSNPRKEFGEALRDARELHPAGKWTQVKLAREARTSSSTISRIESDSDFPIPPHLPAEFDRVFGTEGTFKEIYERVMGEGFAAHSRRRMKLEPDTVAIAEWSPTVIPGLLQTPAYARTLFRRGDPRASDKEIAAMVRSRVARQEVFRRGLPPDFSAIICESVIKRNVGGPDVMREQLGALLAHGRPETNVVQVLLLSAGCHGLMDGSLSLLTPRSGPAVVHTEAIRSSSLVDEPEEVRRLSRSYDVLSALALSPDASAQLIREAMEAL
ncbi:Scr1 family TA system antitoxin-like transcriptional regulator [Streptomyces sp. NPDC091292]|uniref:helix-turn-helix domain-containing protein n=1 Tax=Streptomyces sp. NPDC091292 TaxID=3365991 RepID=UPI0038233E2D